MLIIIYYFLLFRSYNDYIVISRRFFDPARRLHKDCKNPQMSDEQLSQQSLCKFLKERKQHQKNERKAKNRQIASCNSLKKKFYQQQSRRLRWWLRNANSIMTILLIVSLQLKWCSIITQPLKNICLHYI